MGDYIREQVCKFLRSDEREARIRYKGPRLNAAYQWYRLRNPLRMIWTSFIVEVCRKLPPCGFKNSLYRMIGVKIGKDVTICPDVLLDWLFPDLIEIDDGALLGGGVTIAAHSIVIDEFRLGRVRIGKQAMIGSYVCNEPPTRIGDRSVIGVYSYVNKDVPDDAFMVGIPAQLKKDLKGTTYLQEFNRDLKRK
ncbi:MAG: acyltransferase [archaeon]